ncbi:MAG TPA: MarR family transcriptional regulator [Polyangiales bacterium]|nr:MarR family transcriptional regulator [Polyangiales bacterium]
MTTRPDTLAELFETVSLGAPENAVAFVMWRIVHRYQREIDRALEPLGLTHLQFTTLAMAAWLSRGGDAVTQAKLAQAAEISPMQVSHMVKALEQKEMLERTRGSHDSRVNQLAVTRRGVAALRKAMPVVLDRQRELFGPEGAPGGSLLRALREIEKR